MAPRPLLLYHKWGPHVAMGLWVSPLHSLSGDPEEVREGDQNPVGLLSTLSVSSCLCCYPLSSVHWG